jgi:hypothetical protein
MLQNLTNWIQFYATKDSFFFFFFLMSHESETLQNRLIFVERRRRRKKSFQKKKIKNSFEMSLANCSHDVLREIISYLFAHEIFSLIHCGSRTLAASLNTQARILVDKPDCFAKFPFSIFNLPNLQELTIKPNNLLYEFPLNIYPRLPLPFKPLPGLRKLRYFFLQSFTFYGPQPAHLPLSYLFPNLSELNLSRSNAPLTEDLFQTLPRTLRKLSLGTRLKRGSVSLPLPYLVINNLPSCLEELSLLHIKIAAGEDNYKMISFPTSLVLLRIFTFENTTIFNHLPATIETVNIAIDHQGRTLLPTFRSSNLPPSLKSFRWSTTHPLIVDAHLPIGLRRITCRLQADSPEHLEYFLPRSLTELPEFGPTRVDSTALLWSKFPNLKVIVMEDCNGAIPNGAISLGSYSLPPSLTCLYLNNIIERPTNLKQLPATIIDLQMPLGCDEDIELLPPTLLDFQSTVGPNQSFKLHLSTWSKLPRSLTSLRIEATQFETIECLNIITKTCPELRHFSLREAQLFSSDPTFGTQFPSRLQSLFIKEDCAEMDWIGRLGYISKLKELTLASTETFLTVNSPVIDLGPLFQRLPMSLESLYMNRTHITVDSFGHLPRKLKRLHISAFEEHPDESLRITDQHFAHLPASLVEVNIYGGSRLTAKTIKLLPTRIPVVYISLGGRETAIRDEIDAAFKEYYSDPCWGEYRANI